MSAIDPKCHGASVSLSMMKKLVTFFPTVICESEHNAYDTDVDRFHLATDLPSVYQNDGSSPIRRDEWWANVFANERFPTLARLIKAALSIFTCPVIEQSFSGMNDIITAKTNRLSIDTFSAIQSVKFDIRASKETSFGRYRRPNSLRSPVNAKLCRKLIAARSTYHQKLAVNRKRKIQKYQEINIESIRKKHKQSIHKRAEKARKLIFKRKHSDN